MSQVKLVESFVDEWAVEDVKPAFNGDVEAASSLSFAVDNHQRGIVAVEMWKARSPRAAFRAYLSGIWDHDHNHVIQAARTRRRLAAMFHYAEFPLPAHLPERVRVWRGTSNRTLNQARAGYSWTTDRDVACWFAMRFAIHRDDWVPLVLTEEVNKSDIVLFHNDRNESEVVLVTPPKSARIWGDRDDWMRGYERLVKQMQEDHVKRMNALSRSALNAPMS
jgi:hypothetical protein